MNEANNPHGIPEETARAIGDALREAIRPPPEELRARILDATPDSPPRAALLALAAGVLLSVAVHWSLVDRPIAQAPPELALLAGQAPELVIADLTEHRVLQRTAKENE